jgi:hypothetical protein
MIGFIGLCAALFGFAFSMGIKNGIKERQYRESRVPKQTLYQQLVQEYGRQIASEVAEEIDIQGI